MADSEKPNNFLKIFLVFFSIILVLSILITLVLKFRPQDSLVLLPGSFTSSIQKRTATRPDGTTYKYFVINTINNTQIDYYSCHKILTARGTQETFYGFVESYTEPDCKPVESGQNQYACLMSMWYKRFRKLDSAQTYRKFSSRSNYDITLSNFYQETTSPAKNFLSSNTLTDLYSVTLHCKTSAGEQVSHTQIF